MFARFTARPGLSCLGRFAFDRIALARHAMTLALLALAGFAVYAGKDAHPTGAAAIAPSLASFTGDGLAHLARLDTADWQFTALAALQSLFDDHYSLKFASFLCRLLLVWALHALCDGLLRQAGLPRWSILPTYALVLGCLCTNGQLAVFHCFAPEQTLLLAMAVGMAAFFSNWRSRQAIMLLALFAAANASLYYACLPTLTLLSYGLAVRQGVQAHSRRTVFALLALQGLACWPMLDPAGAPPVSLLATPAPWLDDALPVWLIVGSLLPLTLSRRRAPARLVLAIGLLASFAACQWALARLLPEASLSALHFVLETMVALLTVWLACQLRYVWRWHFQLSQPRPWFARSWTSRPAPPQSASRRPYSEDAHAN